MLVPIVIGVSIIGQGEAMVTPFNHPQRDVVTVAMVQVILLKIAPVTEVDTRGPIVEIIEAADIMVITEDREVGHT